MAGAVSLGGLGLVYFDGAEMDKRYTLRWYLDVYQVCERKGRLKEIVAEFSREDHAELFLKTVRKSR